MSRMLDRQEGPFALIEGQMQRCLFLLGIHAKEIKNHKYGMSKPIEIITVELGKEEECQNWSTINSMEQGTKMRKY